MTISPEREACEIAEEIVAMWPNTIIGNTANSCKDCTVKSMMFVCDMYENVYYHRQLTIDKFTEPLVDRITYYAQSVLN